MAFVDQAIVQLTAVLGATEPLPTDPAYAWWRRLFRRRNYFACYGQFMIVKISRIDPPFWGVDKEVVDFFHLSENDYCIVLLRSDGSGWCLRREDVTAQIRRGQWRVAADGDYKVHPSDCPDHTFFRSPQHLRQRLESLEALQRNIDAIAPPAEPRTSEEIRQTLLQAGEDPDAVATRFQALADAAIRRAHKAPGDA